MNILYLFQYIIDPSNGGVERVTQLIGDGLRKRKHNVYYLAVREQLSSRQETFDSKYQYIITGYSKDKIKYLEEYKKLLGKLQIDAVISQQATPEATYLLENTPDKIIRISCYHMQPFAYLGRERQIKKLSYPEGFKKNLIKYLTILCPIPFHRHVLRLEKNEFYDMVRTSDKVVLLSSNFYERIQRYSPDIPMNKLSAINNPNTFEPLEDNDLSKKEKVVLYVGRLADPQKNIKGFIDTWLHFHKSNPEWKAYIVGDGEKRSMYEEYAKNKGAENISFEGKQIDVDSYYARATFICLTSIFEGWGMVLTEGMSRGCIPVCFNTYESAKDIIDNNINGIIAKPLDAHDMAYRMSKLVKSPDSLKQMAMAAIRKTKQFNLVDTVAKWENLLSALHNGESDNSK